jgi:hypothetical protein
MFERRITEDDVQHIVAIADTIEAYPNDSPYPSRLILGWRGTRPLHIVVADNVKDDEVVIITVYEPDPAQWSPDFRRRET